MNRQELEDAISTALILTGRDKAQVDAAKPHLVRNACKLFWRAADWSFAQKTASLTLTDGSATYNCEPDCDKILGIRRTTTDDYGFRLVGLPQNVFDDRFPYPAALPEDAVVYYKILNDDGGKKIVCYPVSDADDTSTVLYKIKFDENDFFRLTPDDYEPTLLVAAGTLVAPPDQLGYAQQAWRIAILEAIKLDSEHGDFPISREELGRTPWPGGSWQLLLSGGNPYARWLSSR